jgi:aminoglycoside phosphotransferase (APT) family kinase protein
VSRQGAELIRRLDFRFLLPRATFRRAVLPGSDPALRDRARSLGLATVVVEAGDGAPPDLMVLSPRDLSLISDLPPGGVVCCEVDRRHALRLTPRRLARRLGNAGLVVRGTWAVRPGLARAESYVPIDAPAPLPWYLRTQYRALTWRQRLAVACVRGFVGEDGRRLAPFAPLYVMVAERAGAPPNGVAGEGSTIVLTDSGDRATLLWFPPGEGAPTVVTKVPKSDAFVERTRREQLTMVDLHARLDGDIAAALPRPLGFSAWGDVAASTESVVPGVSFATRCRAGTRHSAHALRDLADGADWLTQFHAATRNDALDVSAEVATWFDRYLDRFGDVDSGMVTSARIKVSELPPIRPVIRHPDFNVWNLVRHGGHIHVIDWEGSAPGPPLCDLVHFAVHWHECVTRRRPRMPDEDGLRALLAERSSTCPADAAVADAFSRYMHRLAIPDDWFEVLGLTAWVDRALRRERQLVDAGSPREERDRNNFGVRYVEALARAQEAASSQRFQRAVLA